MNEITAKGKVIDIFPLQSGTSKAGKEWQKQDILLEAGIEYKKKLLITFFGDKTDLLFNVDKNTNIQVKINLESREFNGKYYTNITAWDVITDYTERKQPTSTTQTPKDMMQEMQEENNDDLPF